MKRGKFEFEDLAIFKRALGLVEETDRFAARFHGHRRSTGFQMYDAATSVILNLSESRRRTTRADRARFLDMANASASEVAGALCIADCLGIGSEADRLQIRALLHEIMAMLSTMARTLRSLPP